MYNKNRKNKGEPMSLCEPGKKYVISLGTEIVTLIELIEETDECIRLIDLKGNKVTIPIKSIKRLREI